MIPTVSRIPRLFVPAQLRSGYEAWDMPRWLHWWWLICILLLLLLILLAFQSLFGVFSLHFLYMCLFIVFVICQLLLLWLRVSNFLFNKDRGAILVILICVTIALISGFIYHLINPTKTAMSEMLLIFGWLFILELFTFSMLMVFGIISKEGLQVATTLRHENITFDATSVVSPKALYTAIRPLMMDPNDANDMYRRYYSVVISRLQSYATGFIFLVIIATTMALGNGYASRSNVTGMGMIWFNFIGLMMEKLVGGRIVLQQETQLS